MNFRLTEMQRCYPRIDNEVSAAEAAIIHSIRDYLAMTRPNPDGVAGALGVSPIYMIGKTIRESRK